MLPGEFNEVPNEVTVNGVPLIALKMPLSCQPPAIQVATLWVAHLLPLPKGSSTIP